MATATTRSASPHEGEGDSEKAAAAADPTGGHAGAAGAGGKTSSSVVAAAARGDATEGGARGGSRRRRIPLLAWAALGALVAGAYAWLRLGMGFGPPLVMTALGGLTLVLGAGALWRVIDPLTRAESRAAPEVRAPHRIRELEREKQIVLKAIKEIELDYQMRKISEPDYREMMDRYRARALRVMGDLAAGDDYRALIERELKGRLSALNLTQAKTKDQPTRAPEPAASVAAASPPSHAEPAPAGAAAPGGEGKCPACATRNDPDARFCKGCGQNLLARPASVPA